MVDPKTFDDLDFLIREQADIIKKKKHEISLARENIKRLEDAKKALTDLSQRDS
jgi:hypothetical protein